MENLRKYKFTKKSYIIYLDGTNVYNGYFLEKYVNNEDEKYAFLNKERDEVFILDQYSFFSENITIYVSEKKIIKLI
jgi:hypothetical protein